MNERIRELAEQAGFSFKYKTAPNELNPGHTRQDLEKFAELIVRECIDVVDNVYDEQTGMGAKMCRRQTPYQEIVDGIEEHFGVE